MALPSSAVDTAAVDASSMSSPSVAALQTAILSVLHQAQSDCKSRHWDKVIAGCESMILQARQCQQAEVSDSEQLRSQKAFPDQAQACFKAAEAFKQKGNIPEAVRAYLQALQHQPRFYAAYNRLRYNLMRYDIAEGDPVLQEIVDVCRDIVERVPQLQAARVTLAYGLSKLGKTDAATAGYRQTSDLMMQRRLGRSEARAESINWGPRQSPSFMVIGAEKCGTTSLFQYLVKHPSILSPVEKEIDFFDMEYKYGLDWYLAHFPALPAQHSLSADSFAVGETSANYLYNAAAPERVFKHFPTMQLVVLLRHPVDRTISRYNMMVRNGSETRSLEVAITEEMRLIEQQMTPEGIPWPVLNRCRHIGNSLYYYHLQRWLMHFPREQLLVLHSEALFSQPERTLNELCHTLGIGPVPAQPYEKHNAGTYSMVSSALRQQLNSFYRPHVSKLESLLSQKFAWELSS